MSVSVLFVCLCSFSRHSPLNVNEETDDFLIYLNAKVTPQTTQIKQAVQMSKLLRVVYYLYILFSAVVCSLVYPDL